MKVDILGLADQVALNANYLIKVTHLDLVGTAALTKVQELLSLKAGDEVESVRAKVKTVFAGTTTLVVQVGDDGDVDRNLVSLNCKVAGFSGIRPATTSPSIFAAANGLDALFTATVENLTALTQGEIWFYVKINNLNAPEGPRA